MKILVLAGGFDQIALIEELKSRGHYVILADYYEHPMAESAADKFFQISTLDVEKIEALAKAEKVDLITTACTDQALLTVAYVSERLGLPCYLSYETARSVTNKEYMKAKFTEFNIPTAKHVILDEQDAVEDAVHELCFPLIVKPVDCNSSKGVVKVESTDELLGAVRNAIGFSRTKTAVVEEFIEGQEYTVDFWMENNEPRLLMASEITKFNNSKAFVINGCRTLPDLSEEKIALLTNIAKKISEAFSLNNMPLFMQVIDTGERICVLEFSARMGGGTKYRMIELYSGFPIMEKYVDRVLGIMPSVPTQLTRMHMLLSFIYCTKGTLKHIEGIDRLISQNTVTEFYQYKPIGTYFDRAESSGDRVGGILLLGKDDAEIKKKLKKSYETFIIVNEDNEDMKLY